MNNMHTTWSVSFGFFFLLLPLLAGIVAMIAFKRTRVAGIALLCLVGLFIGMAVFWFSLSIHGVSLESTQTALRASEDEMRAIDEWRAARRANEAYLRSSQSRDSHRSRDSQTGMKAQPVATPPAKTATTKAAVAGKTAGTVPKGDAPRMGHGPGKTAIAETKPGETKRPDAKIAEANPGETKKPETKPRSASPLPDWTKEPAHMSSDGAYIMPIVVGPWQTRQECDAQLPGELQKALDRYAEKCLGRPAVPRVILPTRYLQQQVVANECEETLDTSVGPMKQIHLLLRFDDQVKKNVLEEHHRGMILVRLWQVGLGLAVILWPMAVIYAYLKIDLATGGVYRGRLRFAGVLAILAPLAVMLTVVA